MSLHIPSPSFGFPKVAGYEETPPKARPTFTPTPQQQAFLDALTGSSSHIILQARAGCGKTSAILMGVDAYLSTFPSSEVLVCAYNKAIQTEVQEKLTARGYDWKDVQCQTVHSMGMSLLRNTYRPRVEEGKMWRILDEVKEHESRTHSLWQFGSQIVQLVGLGKQSGVGFFDDLPIGDRSVWYEIADHYDVASFEPGVDMDAVVTWAEKLYRKSLEIVEEIDFNDMVLLPLIKGLRVKYRKDLILGDEIQDWSRTRQAIVRMFLKNPGGRLAGVGDDKQAIYGFCHPPGTMVLTPAGSTPIEHLSTGDSIIISSTHGETEGWQTPKKVLAVHQYQHKGDLIFIESGARWVAVTPNHRVPVRIMPEASHFTYLMRRCGVYRVGFCQAYTTGQFMLQLRKKTEKADAVWILNAHRTKQAAREEEERLLWRVKGRSFALMSDAQIKLLPPEEEAALEILSDYGRMVEFPLLGAEQTPVRISRRGAFITEACNLMDGMLIAYYSPEQRDTRRRGRNRQTFNWSPIELEKIYYEGTVYGLTVEKTVTRKFPKHTQEGLPLYFAGNADSYILVHNSGADARAMENMTQELQATVLPLSVTWRCPKKVVEVAQKIVPDLEAADTASEGEVLSQSALFTRQEQEALSSGLPSSVICLEDLTPGQDAILCRNTAPLIPLAYRIIRAGIPAKVEGRKLGEGLVELVNRWTIKTTGALRNKLLDYRDREVAKWTAKGKEAKAEEAEDRVSTILAVVEECERRGKHDISSVVEFIERLFGDNVKGAVTLCTYHRSKGREWDRVLLLEHSSRCPSRAARQAWQLEQERNLAYVSFTRARKTLVFVG